MNKIEIKRVLITRVLNSGAGFGLIEEGARESVYIPSHIGLSRKDAGTTRIAAIGKNHEGRAVPYKASCFIKGGAAPEFIVPEKAEDCGGS